MTLLMELQKYKTEGIAPSCKQEKFKLEKLSKIDVYKGLQNYATAIDWENLFSLFHGKREF